MYYSGPNNAHMCIWAGTDAAAVNAQLALFEGNTVLWNVGAHLSLRYNGVDYTLGQGQICFLAFNKPAEILYAEDVRLVKFNREFYCILDHDAEVGCKGLLFLNPGTFGILSLDAVATNDLEALWHLLTRQCGLFRDNLYEEMLRTLLKGLLITATRLYKEQILPQSAGMHLALIRSYNSLVDLYFKQQHSVAFYAGALHKSPKTLANTFMAAAYASPLEVIHQRLEQEAVKLLRYSEASVKEIAFDLGFEDLPGFSRFFKGRTGQSPRDYRQSLIVG